MPASIVNPYASPNPDAAPPGGLLDGMPDPATAIVAEGPITRDDFRAAQKLNRGAGRFVLILIALALIAFAGGGIQHILANPAGPITIVLGLVAVWLIVVGLVFPRLVAQRVWRRASSLHEPVRRLITPELMQTITASSNVLLRWSMYARHRRNDVVVLLYLREHPRLFTIVARSTFHSDADWARFTEIVEEQIPAG